MRLNFHIQGDGPPLIILHGFLGSLDNWRTMSKRFAAHYRVFAVDLRNQAGGVAGRKVEVLVRGDRQDPERAREVARDLIAEGVAGIVGPMTGAMAVATVPVTDAAEIVLASPTASTDLLAGKDDRFFRGNAPPPDNAIHIARHPAAQQVARRLAAAFDLGNEAYAGSWPEGFRAADGEEGGEMVKASPSGRGSANPSSNGRSACLPPGPTAC